MKEQSQQSAQNHEPVENTDASPLKKGLGVAGVATLAGAAILGGNALNSDNNSDPVKGEQAAATAAPSEDYADNSLDVFPDKQVIMVGDESSSAAEAVIDQPQEQDSPIEVSETPQITNELIIQDAETSSTSLVNPTETSSDSIENPNAPTAEQQRENFIKLLTGHKAGDEVTCMRYNIRLEAGAKVKDLDGNEQVLVAPTELKHATYVSDTEGNMVLGFKIKGEGSEQQRVRTFDVANASQAREITPSGEVEYDGSNKNAAACTVLELDDQGDIRSFTIDGKKYDDGALVAK